jgi:hypothetical protein
MIEKRINIFKVLKQENKLEKICLFGAQCSETDPREHTKTLNYLQAIYIDAFVRDVSVESIVWKYFGNIPQGSKQLICEKKYLNTIKSSYRIKIGDDFYSVYRDGTKDFSIIVRADYIIVIAILRPINY